MMRFWRGACVALCLSVCVAASGQRGFPGFDSQVSIGDALLDYELLSAVLLPDGESVVVLAKTRPRDKPSVPPQLTIASINPSGSVTRATPPGASDVASTRQEAPPLMVQGGPAGPYLLQLGPAGVQLQRTAGDAAPARTAPANGKVMALDGVTAVRAAISLPKNRFLLLGGSRGRALVAEIEGSDATVRWQRELDEPGLTLSGGQLQADGGFVVVGHKTEGTTRQEQVWVGRLDPAGNVKVHRTFPGRLSSIASGSDGAVAVVYHRASGLTADVVLRGLNPTLEEKWERTLLTSQQTPPVFRIAALAIGHFVVAGAENRGLWMSRVAADGAPVWLEKRVASARPDLEMVLSIELLRGPKTLVVPYTAFVVDGGRQSKVVRVVRLSAD